MIGDLELNVMARSYDLFKDLHDDQQRKRVIQWLVSRFELMNSNAFETAVQKMEATTFVPSSGVTAAKLQPAPSRVVSAPIKKKVKPTATPQVEIIATDLISYSIHGLFERVQTKTDVARVLLVAAYLQEKQTGEELGSRQINKELKSISRGIKNITQAINSLLKKDPELLVMTRKTTSSQQGKKKYRVTPLGMEKVNNALVSGVLKV